MGLVDLTMAARIASTGASREELEAAWAFVQARRRLGDGTGERPSGVVGALVAILLADPNSGLPAEADR